MHETAVSELHDISEAIDLAAKVDLQQLDGSTLAAAALAVQGLKAKLTSLGAEVTGAWEASGEYTQHGHRSAKIALRHRRRLHGADAHREVSLARGLRSMPVTAALLAKGEISEAHARRLQRASAKFGPDATVEQLGRDMPQRRADALVEMAQRAMAAPADGKRPEPLVIIHADAATFEAAVASLSRNDVEFPVDRLCELDDGTVITPAEMVEQAILGHVRRIVFGGPGVLLDYGRSQRLFTGALRQAIQARDRQCDHDGCEIPARRCEIDHVVEWQDGGETTHRNGKCKCSFHHRRHKHRR